MSSEYLLGFYSKIKEIKVNKYNGYYNERIKEIREYRYQYQTDLAKICECINISPDYILGCIDEMKPLDKNKRD